MKKLLLVTTLLLVSFSVNLHAQCSGIPDPSCVGTNGPCGILNDGYAGQPYSDTISFWAPNQVDATAQSGGLFGWVDFVDFFISNVSGLPAGLTWSCAGGSCHYNPQPAGVLAGLNICGTPLVAGTYNVTIDIIGTVYLPGLGNQTGPQQYILPLTILAGGGGNSVYSFTPAQGCDSAQVTYTPLMNFPLPQLTGYTWDFGGSVSSVSTTTPIVMNYTSPGIYPVTCTTTVYNLFLSAFEVNVAGQSWWCGDIEELNCSNGNADIVPTFTTGMNNWTGAEVSDNPTPSWGPLGFVLTGTSYSISLVEIDAVSGNDLPAGPYTGTITGPGTYYFNYPGNFSGSFDIGVQTAAIFTATDTVIVYASPPQDTIIATATSFCPYDSVTLSVDSGYYYEWYLNDTVLVQAGADFTYTTSDAGTYTVTVIDPVSGCYSVTDPMSITTSPIVPPGFGNVGITETPPGTYHSVLPPGYTYLWLYYDGFAYFPIPSATLPDYTPTIDGVYCVIATNAAGCSDTSNCIGFYMGIENMSTPFIANVYPNPTDGMININLSNLTEDAALMVHDMIGQTVYNVNIPMGSTNEMYDLSFLPQGMYILEIRNKQHRFTQKVIKN